MSPKKTVVLAWADWQTNTVEDCGRDKILFEHFCLIYSILISFISDKIYFTNFSVQPIWIVCPWISFWSYNGKLPWKRNVLRNSCSHLHFANVLVISDIFANFISLLPKLDFSGSFSGLQIISTNVCSRWFKKSSQSWKSGKHESVGWFWVRYFEFFRSLLSFFVWRLFDPSRGQFHQRSFFGRISQKRKKYSQAVSLIALLGSECVKAARRMLMKLTPDHGQLAIDHPTSCFTLLEGYCSIMY